MRDAIRRQLLVRRIAVALHDAAIAWSKRLQMLAASAGRIGIDDGGRIRSAEGPVVARHAQK